MWTKDEQLSSVWVVKLADKSMSIHYKKKILQNAIQIVYIIINIK